MSFVKYHSAGTEPAGFDQQKDCSSQLTIWDGAAPDADLDRKVIFYVFFFNREYCSYVLTYVRYGILITTGRILNHFFESVIRLMIIFLNVIVFF